MSRFLLRVALACAPRAFRNEYAGQVWEDYRDLAGAPHELVRMIRNVAAAGVAMRIESLWRNVRGAVRTLARTPLFTFVCISTLALAISVNATVFSVIDAVLLRPLPFTDAARLTFLAQDPELSGTIPGAQIRAYQSENRTFAGIATYEYETPTLTGAGVAQSIAIERVSWNLFDVARVTPQLGRFFLAADERGARTIVLSDGMWRRLFDGRADALGKSVRIDNVAYRVVGVAKPGFVMPDERATLAFSASAIAAWLCSPASYFSEKGSRNVYAVGRLLPGVAPSTGLADLSRTNARMAAANPARYKGVGIAVVPLEDVYLGSTRRMLNITFAAVALILLIACANVANLLLVRGAARRYEAGLRSALGASRRALIAEFLSEVAVLAIVGGVLGTLLAFVQVRLIGELAPPDIPRLNLVTIDARAIVFVVLVVGVCMIAAGIIPALFAGRRQLTGVLGAGGRSGGALAGTARTRAVLAGVQIALAFVVLATSSLLIRSWFVLAHTNVGFTVDGAYAGYMLLGEQRYAKGAAILLYVNRALERVSALPGVTDAAVAYNVPCTRGAAGASAFHVVGKPPPPNPVAASLNFVTTHYFETMRIPLLRGRTFDVRDRAGSRPIVIISDVLARREFGNADPVGKQLAFDPANSAFPPRTIVGVVGSVRNRLDGRLRGTIYVPFAQYPVGVFQIVLRSNASRAAITQAVTAAVSPLDPLQAPPEILSLRENVDSWAVPQRTNALLFALLAVVVLALAFCGIYGVVAHSVTQRAQEFGIRMALGARRATILGGVMYEAMRIALTGAIVGLAASALTIPAVAGLLFAITPFDPFALAMAAFALIACAIVSAFIPAGRVTKLSPLKALRYE